jgi:Golgi phosphoprotein 3 (GPP34)
MTTPQDLLIVTMDVPAARPVERGDLSLALAGAEAVDLLGAGAIRVEADRIVPAGPAGPGVRGELGDALLDDAAASLVREEPYEPVGEWLWRRGRGLAEAYLDAMEGGGLLARESRRRWKVVRSSQLVLVDCAERRRAHHRWTADEPVLAELATAIGVGDRRTDEASPSGGIAPVGDAAVATVLLAVTEAVAELSEERRRRAHRLQDAAADNVRRGY